MEGTKRERGQRAAGAATAQSERAGANERPRCTLPTGRAICYSGYRSGQSPRTGIYPSLDEIRQDLLLLAPHWPLLRLYDCSLHARRVLEVIRSDGLPFQVMLGAQLAAELGNPGCPWGASYSAAELRANAAENEAEVERLITLANAHPQIVFSVAAGNEATVEWTDHLVSLPRLSQFVAQLKRSVAQPVTFCENYVPWQHKLLELAEALDFVSLHSYPLWEYRRPDEALNYTRANFDSVAALYPHKPVIITEAGWCTGSNGRGMHAADAVEPAQARYLRELMDWADRAGVLCFVFEAFDEAWKGSDDPLEPEKHWGIYSADRQAKQVMMGWR